MSRLSDMGRIKRTIGVGDVKMPKSAKKYISQVLKSKRITYGPFAEKFERAFAKEHQLRYAIFCNSGTSALQVSLHALKKKYKWKDGDEVLVPALTFVATVNIVIQNNLKPVFVDIDKDFFEIDPTQIEKNISKKTRAVIPVHIGGLPCDMDPLVSLCKKYNLKMIEDSCETVSSRYKGKSVGSFGDFGCFSTYAAHTLVTGVGGFIGTNNPELAVMAKSLVNHGRDGIYLSIDDDNTKDEKKLFSIVDKRFHFIDVGYSYRATEFESALGVAQMEGLAENIRQRKVNAQLLSKKLSRYENFLQLPRERADADHTYMFYPIIVDPKYVKRKELVYFLESKGIETRFLLPLLNQPVYINLYGDMRKKFPVATHIAENGFYIGCHQGLKRNDIYYIIDSFDEFFSKKASRI